MTFLMLCDEHLTREGSFFYSGINVQYEKILKELVIPSSTSSPTYGVFFRPSQKKRALVYISENLTGRMFLVVTVDPRPPSQPILSSRKDLSVTEKGVQSD
jgi:hypothetical protein